LFPPSRVLLQRDELTPEQAFFNKTFKLPDFVKVD
jgi:hypothetical protein